MLYLGEQQNQETQENCWNDLNPQRYPPLSAVGRVEANVGAVADPGGTQRANS